MLLSSACWLQAVCSLSSKPVNAVCAVPSQQSGLAPSTLHFTHPHLRAQTLRSSSSSSTAEAAARRKLHLFSVLLASC